MIILQAEVQSLHADGSIALHTRSAKYGKVIHFTESSCVGTWGAGGCLSRCVDIQDTLTLSSNYSRP